MTSGHDDAHSEAMKAADYIAQMIARGARVTAEEKAMSHWLLRPTPPSADLRAAKPCSERAVELLMLLMEVTDALDSICDAFNTAGFDKLIRKARASAAALPQPSGKEKP